MRLGLIVVFSACFSLAPALMTNARTIEVFAATAAFAAVNVVFLTSNPTCTLEGATS
ncbi:Uu.00g048350.m01.CDS01 [Anthostomella pinea]|uniref:Uu.00g048350.m01.CDS01 n=1 Tax=Anthostomella pinea TaxID=933095 RepID=A0AAI8VC83_9PEZI|nr:Uu.00g048350.m01.CDS01 [Anthostomella pinea]